MKNTQRVHRTAFAISVGASLTLAAACGVDTQLTANYAPEFAGLGHHTISVFGVFKDGRMDTEAWGGVATGISSRFGQGACSPGFDADLLTHHADVTSAVDEYTRHYGVTDPLLSEFAASARGDLILVFSIAGKPATQVHKGLAAEAPLPMSRKTNGRPDPDNPVGFRPVEVSASLFSVPLRRSVASIVEHYSGDDADQAITKLEDKLKEALPVATCDGWDFDAHPVDDSRVRALPEP